MDGIEVCSSAFSLRSYRAAPCLFLVPVTADNKEKALADYTELLECSRCQGLRVSGLADLSFLDEFPNLLYLEIADQKRVNTRQLDTLTNLRGLYIESPGAGVDFTCFPELESCGGGQWDVANRHRDQARELRQLRIWGFRPASKDLSDLANIPRLECLELSKTTISSIAGIETLEDLRYVDMAYAPKLESIDAFGSKGIRIRELAIENAKAIASYKPIASIDRLRRLRLSHCAAMPDLKWTKGMRHLDSFAFVETNVENGDLSPLLKLSKLRYVGTMDKRHYNYKFRELNEILDQRNA